MNLIDTIHCETEEFAKDLFDLYIAKGYAVLKSVTVIKSGIKGEHVAHQLMIMKRESGEKTEWV